jgi:branched-chain amino acid transport system substrate-binding protein
VKNIKLSRASLLVVSMILIFAMCLISCGQTNSTTAPASTSASGPASTQAQAPTSTQAQAPATNTLKIGVIATYKSPIGLEFINSLKVLVDMDNQNGGITIGGNKYNIQTIIYDSDDNQGTAVAAANKLIYEDKVKYILADQNAYVDAWLATSEANKVLVSGTPSSNPILSPKYHYCFLTGFQNAGIVEMTGFLAKQYPDKKNFLCAYPDEQTGHASAAVLAKVLTPLGMNVTNLFYPMSQQDLSAVGTKVRVTNPDYFWPMGGGMSDVMCIKAARQAGWTGTLIIAACASMAMLSSFIPAEMLEGYYGGAWPTEFDPALTDKAIAFKAAYTAKYGKWDGPEIQDTGCWTALETAFIKADSLDTDKLAEVLSNGLRYEGPTGPSQMVARPDQGNTRTVDSVGGYNVKTVVGGKIKLVGTYPLDDAVASFNKMFAQ